MLIASTSSVHAQDTSSGDRLSITQNSILNMFVSAIPKMANIELRQVGVINGVTTLQAVPRDDIASSDQNNFLLVSQKGRSNTVLAVQVGRTNVAVITQQGNGAAASYLDGGDYEFRQVANGYLMRFRSGQADIVSIAPGGLTAISSFGRQH